MAQASTVSSPSVSDSGDNALATVRLEVRSGGGRATVYEVGDGGFLIGSVPGCDLRLPGSNLPPVICAIGRAAVAASLRRLAPVLPILVNGKAVASAYLNDGDRVTIGPVEIVSSVQTPSRSRALSARDNNPDGHAGEREQQMNERAECLERDRALWEKRCEEIESEYRQRAEGLQQIVQRLRRQEQELTAARLEQEERESAWKAQHEGWNERQEDIAKRDQESESVRRELLELRQQLYQRYHERRERLIKQQQAIHKAARRLQQRKQRIDTGEAELTARRQEWEQKQIEIEGRSEQSERERQLLEEQHRLIVSRQQEVQRDVSERAQNIEAREKRLAELEAALDKGQKQHQADLVRLDRIQAKQEQRQKQLQAAALEVDHRYEQLQRDTRDLEEQAAQLDEWHNRLVGDTEGLAQRKKEQDERIAQLDQRAAALEGQQAMLATLRTRLERMREDLRSQEQALGDQRVLQEATENDLRARLAEAEKLRSEVANEREWMAEERRRSEERRTTLEAAVVQLRQARETLDGEENQLRQEQEQVRNAAADQAEQAALLTARSSQLEQEQEKIANERQTLLEREMALARAEQALAALQEQVRGRVEELTEKQRGQGEEDQRLKDEATRLGEAAKILEQDRELAESRLNLARQELGQRAAEMDEQARKLVEEEERNKSERQRLEEIHASLGGQRQVLASERIAFEVERQKGQDHTQRLRAELEARRQEAVDLTRHLPEIEARASAALDRLTQAREQLREHLAEIHGYVRQSRGDLERMRHDFQADIERVRQRELDLHVARDEHRLSAAAFRQHILEWQGRLTELRQALHLNESRVERRASEVDEQARQIADTSARLAQQVEQLQQQERQVGERRGEVDRHLSDMQEWYRRKMRELAGLDLTESSESAAPAGDERGILSIVGQVDAGDKQLGDLLRSLGLIDGDTLAALYMEGRRQRRSLRQLLLAGNYLTLYQIALIEAGNLDGLVLGPVRVVDRLQATPREAMYRVFDPRRNSELLLRHLSESEMEDAVRPDEFRQRFAAAAMVQQKNVAQTVEVLEIASRPAALQEWLHGLPSTEWPILAGAPGVWCRLMTQAGHALQAIHAAGLVHGNLHASSFVFARDGVLKLCGLGEPRWLAVPMPQEDGEPSIAGDFAAMGHIAAGWAAVAPTAKGGKTKGLPPALQSILNRFHCEDETQRYTNAAQLLEDLDGAQVPPNDAAWERFVRQVRDESAAAAMRESA